MYNFGRSPTSVELKNVWGYNVQLYPWWYGTCNPFILLPHLQDSEWQFGCAKGAVTTTKRGSYICNTAFYKHALQKLYTVCTKQSDVQYSKLQQKNIQFEYFSAKNALKKCLHTYTIMSVIFFLLNGSQNSQRWVLRHTPGQVVVT